MIDIVQSTQQRAVLNAVYDRVREYHLACEHADGSYRPGSGVLTPPLNSRAYENDYRRNARTIKSAAERVLGTKIDGAVGSLIINAESERAKSALREYDWMSLARASLRQYLLVGIMAGYAFVNENFDVSVSNINEYVETYNSQHDSSKVEGLYQTYEYAKNVRNEGNLLWAVNVYDWTSEPGTTIRRRYRNLSKPTSLGMPAVEEELSTPVRYRLDQNTRDAQGVNQGIISSNIPLFNDLLACDLRLRRALDYVANPMLRVDPESQRPDSIGPAEVIVSKSAEYLKPGDLTELREARQAAEWRIARDLRMPASFVTALPSGEALREVNLTFYQVASNHASVLTDYLTELARDYLELRNINDDTASIAIAENKVYLREIVMEDAKSLFRDGVIPLDVAAAMVQTHIDEFSPERLEEWKNANGTITPESLERLIQ